MPPKINPPRLAWTIPETAMAVGVTKLCVIKAIREGLLRVCKIGPQTIRVLPEEALLWLRKTLSETPTP